MKHRSKRRRADTMVSAPELAQMGRCEQLVVFEHRHGQRRLPHQQAARHRGLAELVRRSDANFADRITPRYAAEARHCQGCAFRILVYIAFKGILNAM